MPKRSTRARDAVDTGRLAITNYYISTPMDDDEREWKQAVYERAVADPQVKALAWNIANHATGEASPAVNAGDMAAARRYLRACMLNMTVTELQAVTSNELAGLLARGAMGAARHRTRADASSALPSSRARHRRAR